MSERPDAPRERRLRITGRAFATGWHERTYSVLLEERVSERTVGTRLVGYVHRSDIDGWIVRDEDGRLVVSAASGRNWTREAALRLAEEKLGEWT